MPTILFAHRSFHTLISTSSTSSISPLSSSTSSPHHIYDRPSDSNRSLVFTHFLLSIDCSFHSSDSGRIGFIVYILVSVHFVSSSLSSQHIPTPSSTMSAPVCNDYMRGKCFRGDACRYAHSGAAAPAVSSSGGSAYGSSYSAYGE